MQGEHNKTRRKLLIFQPLASPTSRGIRFKSDTVSVRIRGEGHLFSNDCGVTASWSATAAKSAKADANSKKTARNSSSNARANTVHAGSAECPSTTTHHRTPQTTASTSTTSIPSPNDQTCNTTPQASAHHTHTMQQPARQQRPSHTNRHTQQTMDQNSIGATQSWTSTNRSRPHAGKHCAKQPAPSHSTSAPASARTT